MIELCSDIFHLSKFTCSVKRCRKAKARYPCRLSRSTAGVAYTHFPWALAQPCLKKVYWSWTFFNTRQAFSPTCKCLQDGGFISFSLEQHMQVSCRWRHKNACLVSSTPFWALPDRQTDLLSGFTWTHEPDKLPFNCLMTASFHATWYLCVLCTRQLGIWSSVLIRAHFLQCFW